MVYLIDSKPSSRPGLSYWPGVSATLADYSLRQYKGPERQELHRMYRKTPRPQDVQRAADSIINTQRHNTRRTEAPPATGH